MSSALMSCVRENSPPMDMAGNDSDTPSFASASVVSGTTSAPLAGEQPKRRRFHPLRNLRRIFRRRTLTNGDVETPAATSQSTDNSYSSIDLHPKHQTPTVRTSSVPAHSSSQHPSSSALPNTASDSDVAMSSAAFSTHRQLVGASLSQSSERSSRFGTCGVAIIPIPGYGNASTASSGPGFKARDRERSDKQKGDSTNDLDDSRDMSGNLRSLSEGRLMDSEYGRDGLSQSHDSVFSESATASSLSIVLKAELADVLRKRRNRPDASDEDLGLPHSPTTPQRREIQINANQSEVSSLSLLSMASSDLMDDEVSMNQTQESADRTMSSMTSSKYSQDSSRTSDEIDLSVSGGSSRLSHSAARHKMAVRPKKNKGPSRHRRPIDVQATALPSTPEVNEDMLKVPASFTDKDFSSDRAKSRSLPPGVNAKILEQHSVEQRETKQTFINIKRSKTEKGPSTSSGSGSIRNMVKSSTYEKDLQSSTETESGFFKRFLLRNSKREVKSKTDECDSQSGDKTDPQFDSMDLDDRDSTQTAREKSIEYSQRVEETREEIRREILSEARGGLSAMLNTFILSQSPEERIRESVPVSQAAKPKSGPAARQRFMPLDLTNPPEDTQPTEDVSGLLKHEISRSKMRSVSESSEGKNKTLSTLSTEKLNNDKLKVSAEELSYSTKLSRSLNEDTFQSTSLIRDVTFKTREHYEKKDQRYQPKIVGLSAFQQKISRSNDSFTRSSDSLKTSDDSEPLSPTTKQRKAVEKSKSFRGYSDVPPERDSLKSNMPSLPDLSFTRNTGSSDELSSLGFEINDNNLVKEKPDSLPLSHGIYTKNIILTTSKSHSMQKVTTNHIQLPSVTPPCNKDINEIEDSIDQMMKSPCFIVKAESKDRKLPGNISITPMTGKKIDLFERKDSNESSTSPGDTPSPKKKVDILQFNWREKATSSNESSGTEERNSPTENSTMGKIDITKVQMRNKVKNFSEFQSIERKSLADITKPESPTRSSQPQPTNGNLNKPKRSSSIIENGNTGVPEFMKIQLNRVDPSRPKSNIVFSNAKSTKEASDDVVKRYSNDSVEIAEDSPEVEKPVMRPDRKSPVDGEVETKRKSSVSEAKTALMAAAEVQEKNRKSFVAEAKASAVDVEKRRKSFGFLKSDGEVKEAPMPSQLPPKPSVSSLNEKKKFFTEKKLEESRKSISDEGRKSSIDDETNVVMRKKPVALGQTSTNKNKDDGTPELMKVFARRSLKIKDEDLQSLDEIKVSLPPRKPATNLDSDKENQSSSEEKLDNLPKVEITIQQQSQTQKKNDNDFSAKNRNSLSDFRNKPQIQTNGNKTNNINNNNLIGTPTKSFLPTPIRNSNNITAGFRSLNKSTSFDQSISNERNNNAPNTPSISTTTSNSIFRSNPRHTIGATPPLSPTAKAAANDQNSKSTEETIEGEFKGIHQRRAEWEKRAKEALK